MANFCKFEKKQKFVSYDSGVTWFALQEYEKGNLIEYESPDCGYVPPIEPIYKWETNGWVCDDCGGEEGIAFSYTYYTNNIEETYSGYSSCNDGINYMGRKILAGTIGTCVTEIPRATFSGQTDLVYIIIPDTITTIGDFAFSVCTSIIDLTLPNSVTSIGYRAFYNCVQLSTIFLPNSLTSLGEEAFQYCYNIQYINIPSGLTEIQRYTFYNCAGLSDVVIPDTVETIGESAYQMCSGLSYLSIGSGVTSIGFAAFYGCSRLQKVTITATTPPMLESSVFDDTNNCPIYVPSGSVEAYKAASGWSAYSNRIQAIS